MRIEWDAAKNRLLWGARKIGFEVVEQVLEEGTYEIRAHPDRQRHPNQILLIFEFRAYTWVCPAVRSADALTLKTVYPSRKYHRLRRNHG